MEAQGCMIEWNPFSSCLNFLSWFWSSNFWSSLCFLLFCLAVLWTLFMCLDFGFCTPCQICLPWLGWFLGFHPCLPHDLGPFSNRALNWTCSVCSVVIWIQPHFFVLLTLLYNSKMFKGIKEVTITTKPWQNNNRETDYEYRTNIYA